MTDKIAALQNAIIASDVPQIAEDVVNCAIDVGASDIHIEPSEYTIRIRFRVDGILRQIVEYPPSIHSALVSRLKIMGNLKIDESRIPQDGRVQVTTPEGKELDLRLSTLPTVHGEKIVMRLQDRSRRTPKLEELGIEPHNLKILKRAISAPNGILLTTGPTGSGKTTTLYSCLDILNTPEVNIMTIEDPVEIQMDGLNQSQVHPAINYTFAYGLRTGLRQDPDIIMVGEIRDRETIEVAVEAALTGHLVLSTIHTNSAVSTITRLLDMDVPAFLITATVNAIIAQRLVRKICEKCKKEDVLTPAVEKKLRKAISTMNLAQRKRLKLEDESTPLKIYHGEGCDQCGDSGYKGRMGLYEILEMSNQLKNLILKSASPLEIEAQSIAEGMKTLEHDGVEKILAGVTTPEEVYAVARATEDESEDDDTDEIEKNLEK
ncbi:GspE/PulE family protein [Candidatus Gracilibacteria bacterium]|nr:GspE/PulE family protein [Candidatus Gracilibacteria bacterium]MCF7856156.1 GspE/PulE family protein [Candidatus Gracilibacteria bacterium]MCF7896622.1 GspE/PulE family protein [Candidatus Gracilibacteria bacterium]